MMKEFEMSDLGLLHYFLGLQVRLTKDEIYFPRKTGSRFVEEI